VLDLPDKRPKQKKKRRNGKKVTFEEEWPEYSQPLPHLCGNIGLATLGVVSLGLFVQGCWGLVGASSVGHANVEGRFLPPTTSFEATEVDDVEGNKEREAEHADEEDEEIDEAFFMMSHATASGRRTTTRKDFQNFVRQYSKHLRWNMDQAEHFLTTAETFFAAADKNRDGRLWAEEWQEEGKAWLDLLYDQGLWGQEEQAGDLDVLL